MQPIITENREKIAELCRAHHVRRLSVFGSAVRDDFDPERSDVDLLVEFEPLPYPTSIDHYWSLEDALREIFQRKIDLIREGLIRNPYLLAEIRRDQVTLMPRKLEVSLWDARAAGKEILEYTAGKTLADYLADRQLRRKSPGCSRRSGNELELTIPGPSVG